ncbi:MFS transporter [Siccirubricoccus sp. G192]|uniref:MFS transporter n=1 Tax=Siccirubricoccus sp. G192 TaxID=2849651 RepID=UPI001C2C9775|nr:MFS transporter [Siccirubricoccus sp. G192]MBV1795723.1 MFS transporter [Siccirubricoccus sp. G192]
MRTETDTRAGALDKSAKELGYRSGSALLKLAHPANAERTFRMTQGHAAADAPDSLAGWLATLSAFIAGFVAFGVMYSFGVFFSPMEAEFHASRTATSVFFAVTGMLFYSFGSVTGRLSDRVGPRRIIATGAVIMGAGLALTAAAPRMWIGYLTYGVGVGIGASCAYIPTLALVGGWFDRHRTTALGLAAAGTGCGTLLIPPAAAVLIQAHGWRMAYALFGAGSFLLLLLCARLARQPPLARAAQTTTLRSVVRSRPFALLYASWVLATTGLVASMVFLPPFAHATGVSPVAASALISIIGGMSILGRGGIGLISRKVGLVRLYKISVLVMAASYLLWLPFTGYGWLVAFAATLGFGYGLRIALTPVVLIELFGLGNLGAILGVFFTASSISALCGPLVAGLIIDRTGSYQWGVAFALVMGVLGFLAVAPLRSDCHGSGPVR